MNDMRCLDIFLFSGKAVTGSPLHGTRIPLAFFYKLSQIIMQVKKILEKIVLNDKFILSVIFLNVVAIYLQECGFMSVWIRIADVSCTIVFIVEMAVKLRHLGLRGYWSQGWNCLDGTLVILALPSLIAFLLPADMRDLSFLMVVRAIRIFRFFRVIHLFPNFTQIAKAFGNAMKESYALFIGFFIIIFIFALVSCSLFKEVSPDYFATPMDSVYSIFRLFTVEGWYEIPNNVASGFSGGWVHWIRIYFCLLLVLGGVIGLSLINSIFVDAMAGDNNDDVKAQLDEIERKLDRLMQDRHAGDDAPTES